MNNLLVTVGRKNTLLTGRNLWHSQVYGGAAICFKCLRV